MLPWLCRLLLPLSLWIGSRIVCNLYHHAPDHRGAAVLLLVIAHPDDEAMFFTPALRAAETARETHILCLSTGNAHGQGAARVAELYRSGAEFGIPAPRIVVVDHPDLQDGLNVAWDVDVAAEIIARKMSDIGATMVFTFDQHGASWHANHKSVYRAMRIVQAEALAARGECNESGGREESNATVFYFLQTVPLWRKYLGVLDLLFLLGSERDPRSPTPAPSVLTFVQCDASLSWAAMQQHTSQFVWYRRAAVWMSRYSYVNVMRAEESERPSER